MISLHYFILPSQQLSAEGTIIVTFSTGKQVERGMVVAHSYSLSVVELGFESRSDCSKAHSPSRIISSPCKMEGEEDKLCLPYKSVVIILQRLLVWH